MLAIVLVVVLVVGLMAVPVVVLAVVLVALGPREDTVGGRRLGAEGWGTSWFGLEAPTHKGAAGHRSGSGHGGAGGHRDHGPFKTQSKYHQSKGH